MSVPIDISCLSNKEIQRILKNEGKSTSGNKATLIERLRSHLVEKQKSDSRHDGRDEDDECPDDDDYGLGASKYANFTTMTLRFRSAKSIRFL